MTVASLTDLYLYNHKHLSIPSEMKGFSKNFHNCSFPSISCLFSYNLEVVITFDIELQSPHQAYIFKLHFYPCSYSYHSVYSMHTIFNGTEEFILSIDEMNNKVCLAIYYLVIST